MVKDNVLRALYSKQKSPLEFQFDSLTAPPLLSLLSVYDIAELNKIARSIKLSGKIDLKYKMIDDIMTARGFVKLHAGTNRVVYRFIEDQRFVIKVAVDKVGLGDNPAEFKNQFLLKPFVTRVFEVSPCGTVGLFERVDAIMSREEFLTVADDIFNLITKVFVGKYVLADFGTRYFLNWAIRENFGPVLLDFPYVYELDGKKLFCNAPKFPGSHERCGGQLDYDDGFNNLICTKCGKHYQAQELKKAEENNEIFTTGGKRTMKVRVKLGSEVIYDNSKNKKSKVITPKEESNNYVEFEPVSEEKPKQEKKTTTETNTVNKVESRLNTRIEEEKKVEVPSAAIFNKKKEEKPKEEQTSGDSMVEELDDYINSLDYDLDDDESDEDEYDQYLSNRDRQQNKASNKTRKRNNDFSDF